MLVVSLVIIAVAGTALDACGYHVPFPHVPAASVPVPQSVNYVFSGVGNFFSSLYGSVSGYFYPVTVPEAVETPVFGVTTPILNVQVASSSVSAADNSNTTLLLTGEDRIRMSQVRDSVVIETPVRGYSVSQVPENTVQAAPGPSALVSQALGININARTEYIGPGHPYITPTLVESPISFAEGKATPNYLQTLTNHLISTDKSFSDGAGTFVVSDSASDASSSGSSSSSLTPKTVTLNLPLDPMVRATAEAVEVVTKTAEVSVALSDVKPSVPSAPTTVSGNSIRNKVTTPWTRYGAVVSGSAPVLYKIYTGLKKNNSLSKLQARNFSSTLVTNQQILPADK